MTLFTLSRSYPTATWLFEQLAYAHRHDTILLLGDAVYAIVEKGRLDSFVAKCDAFEIDVCYLRSDSEIRGIGDMPRVNYPRLRMIDYSDWVDLVAKCERCVSW